MVRTTDNYPLLYFADFVTQSERPLSHVPSTESQQTKPATMYIIASAAGGGGLLLIIIIILLSVLICRRKNSNER